MAGDLEAFAVKLTRIANGIEDPRVVRAGGVAAKRAVLEVAASVAGPDLRFSGWGRKGLKLGAGFDELNDHEIELKLRPYGPWMVAQGGRKANRSRKVGPRRRSGARALRTPYGAKANVTIGATRGRDAIDRAFEDGAKAAIEGAAAEVTKVLREVF